MQHMRQLHGMFRAMLVVACVWSASAWLPVGVRT
jgi:hypothetical protein